LLKEQAEGLSHAKRTSTAVLSAGTAVIHPPAILQNLFASAAQPVARCYPILNFFFLSFFSTVFVRISFVRGGLFRNKDTSRGCFHLMTATFAVAV